MESDYSLYDSIIPETKFQDIGVEDEVIHLSSTYDAKKEDEVIVIHSDDDDADVTPVRDKNVVIVLDSKEDSLFGSKEDGSFEDVEGSEFFENQTSPSMNLHMHLHIDLLNILVPPRILTFGHHSTKTQIWRNFFCSLVLGGFPFYSIYPHNHFPIFEKVELKIDKWSLKYFVIEFPVHSPIDLPGVVLRRSISRTRFAAAGSAEGVYNALKGKEGLSPHHSLQEANLYKKAGFYYPLGPDPIPFEEVPSPERLATTPAAESTPAGSSSRVQSQGHSTTMVVRNPVASLDVVPLSAIPGLRRPTPSQKRPREGVTDDDFLPKRNRGDNISVSPSPLSTSSGPQNSSSAATPGSLGLEVPNPGSLDWEVDEHPAEDEAEVLLETEISHPEENEVQQTQEEQREPDERHPATAPPTVNLPIRSKFTPRTYSAFAEGWEGFSRGLRSLQASHWIIQGNLERMQGSVQEPKTPQARPDLLALNALHLVEQILQGENARLQADGSTELVAERSKVQSLQDQIANSQRETQDLEMQFERFRAQVSSLESRASASENQVGSLKAELAEKESRISTLEESLQDAKRESSRYNEFALKQMEARRLVLEQLKGERQAASELREKVDGQEKTIAAHQEEVATLIARAQALYEEGQFDMQQCIYGAVC
ncbi:unnamed protein product [Cuscuta campestris]|uniref:Uncharacterized protein n=1 Tax=Cuscuta campestris TaxID=132261 RepID=A0A484LBX2_9ASTE|nr:unnamed protein product [Cuscuta campestris]